MPGEHCISATRIEAFNSEWEKEQHKRQQSHWYEPDVKILVSRKGKHGLLIEVKKDGAVLKMRSNDHKNRLYKDKIGWFIGADYKIRKKGD